MSARNIGMSRQEFFDMAGLEGPTETYTPVSVGKGFKLRDTNNNWISNLRNANFLNADQLRELKPEHVTESAVIVPIEMKDDEGTYFLDQTPQERYKAIVGDTSKKVYSIRSNKYHTVQHADIAEAFADVSDSTGIRVFGKLTDKGGNMNIHGFFADPDCNIDLSARNEDPAMLGVRCFNSHNGTTKFGGEIIGVRYLCSNMCAFGETLGRISWTHNVERENVVGSISDMIRKAFDRVPVLQERIAEMQETVLTLDEAECALWGISLNPYKVEAVSTHLEGLNPEIGSEVTQYDLWNAVNAYTTYAVSGGSVQSKSNELNNTENLMTASLPRIIRRGYERRESYIKTINLEGATVVG